LAHPKHEVAKRYLVQVRGVLPSNLTSVLKGGVELEDGLVRLSAVTILARSEKSALLEIELHEGRNRIIRRLFAQLELPVEHLVRIGVGTIDLGELRPGRWRAISDPELKKLLG
jgi:23S rRNA pseudouridine2605 synthase